MKQKADDAPVHATPEVLQLVEAPSQERMKDLEEKGIRVEVIKASSIRPPATTQRLTLKQGNNKKKRKKGKKK